MDLVEYALIKKRIQSVSDTVSNLQDDVDNVTLAYTYKGSVASNSALPTNAQLGDLYTVSGDQYVWDGTSWVLVGLKITDAQINSIFS